jgi:mono/diheme cytochrome c family protein
VKRLILIVLALTLAVALPACGGGEDESATPETVEGTVTEDTGDGGGEGDAENGASVFASAGCGGCHTLSDAGSSGSIGPNLDDLAPSQEQVAAKVRVGGGGMPAFEGQLSDQEIQDVAAYVSSVAGG